MFEFNTNPEFNTGFLMVSRRPKELKTGDKLKACFNCRKFCTATNLRHHVQKCTNKVLAGERVVSVLSRKVECRAHKRATDMLVDRMAKLVDDNVTLAVRYDWLLIAFGNKIAVRFKAHFQHRIVRAKLRLAGRILLNMKSICPEVFVHLRTETF